LRVIDAAIEGDYFLGSRIRLIDVLIYPWFERWVILEHYFGVGLAE
jgi:glutathione S-transferase